MEVLGGERRSQTADDYDRLVLQSPDSSLVWLQYMAFHLEATEIDKARSVAERALKTISFRWVHPSTVPLTNSHQGSSIFRGLRLVTTTFRYCAVLLEVCVPLVIRCPGSSLSTLQIVRGSRLWA